MFTGIVQDQGRIVQVQAGPQDRELVVAYQHLNPPLRVGDSVAVDGVCQTVTHVEESRFRVHAVAETLRVTTLGQLRPGDRVNLETAVAAGSPMGGHFVQGHVDGIARIESRDTLGESTRMTFSASAALVGQLVPKGSVCLDGISLTVGPTLGRDRFEVYLIPHTLAVTTLGTKGPGDDVNLETDILGKYVLRAVGGTSTDKRLEWDDLRRTGFLDSPGRGEIDG